MHTISTLEPTRYEITAVHPDGRTYLVPIDSFTDNELELKINRRRR